MPNDSEGLTALELQRRGGLARAKKLTSEERTRIAKLAAQARWAKKATAPDPNDPKASKREGRPRPGIMSTRKPCRRTGLPLKQPRLFENPLFEIPEPLHVRAA